MLIYTAIVVVLSILTHVGVYLYGCHVGVKAGGELGRAASDREWSAMLENGMV